MTCHSPACAGYGTRWAGVHVFLEHSGQPVKISKIAVKVTRDGVRGLEKERRALFFGALGSQT